MSEIKALVIKLIKVVNLSVLKFYENLSFLRKKLVFMHSNF